MLNCISTKFLGTRFAILTAMSPLFLTISSASAFRPSCKDVYLKVQNNTGNPIKVIDLDYWDQNSEKWRSELVPNEIIPNGQPWQATRNLERINNLTTKVRVDYRTRTKNIFGKESWSFKVSKAESKSETCKKGQIFQITLD